MTSTQRDTIYFDLKASLAKHHNDGAEQASNGAPLTHFTFTPPRDEEEKERVFKHKAPEGLLDFAHMTESDFKKLISLFEESQLYRINLIFLMDRALSMREDDLSLHEILSQGFAPYPLPKPLAHSDSDNKAYQFSGDIKHLFLDQCSTPDLIHAYVHLITYYKSKSPCAEFCFLDVIRSNPDAFLREFSGFCIGENGYTQSDTLLLHCHRCSHQPSKPLETYVEQGQSAARSIAFADDQAIIEAWYHADQFQKKRCAIIDQALQTGAVKGSAEWIKIDVFTILEREAMKQTYAEMLHSPENEAHFPSQARSLETAIKHNTNGGTDKHLQQLLAQTLTPDQSYAGAAAAFCLDAERRELEFKKLTDLA